MRKPSVILTFSVADKRDVFMPNRLSKEKEALEECIDTLVLE